MIRAKLFIVSCIIILSGSLAYATTKIANDPTNVIVGARVLGMGGAYISLADDPSAIFLNPAGLGQTKKLQLSSMSGRFANLFDQIQLTAVIPTKLGTFGIGYGGTLFNFSLPSAEVVTIGDQTRIIASGEASGKYNNTAVILAYGHEASFFNRFNFYLGGSLKLLSQELKATGLVDGTASGKEINLGLLFPVNKKIRLAVSGYNLLPDSSGGKITWSNNSTETFPARVRFGLSYKPIYAEIGQPQELKVLLDLDRYITISQPNLLHVGIEWSFAEIFFLRAGLDPTYNNDDSGNTSVANDQTYGLGLAYKGYRFDYAYHYYGNQPSNATNYFSLSYGIWPERKEIISAEVIAANQEVKLNIPLHTFSDVPATHWAADEISHLATLGILGSTLESTFQPDADVSRGDLLLVLLKLNKSLFIDSISRPKEPVTRAESLIVIFRKLEIGLPRVLERPYQDVSARHWAIKEISAAKQLGLLDFVNDNFLPNQPLTRAELAYVLFRTDKVKEELHSVPDAL
ncbi:MAG: S-layer homology domain-containing protein [bacterium]